MNYKAAFFDIDGVLSVPRFTIDGCIKPGYSAEQWAEVTSESDDVYRDCRAPKCVKELLDSFVAQGVKLFVLSTESLEDAIRSKRKFIENNYKEYFPSMHQFYVPKDKDKLKILKAYAADEVRPEDVYYMDDTYSLVLGASELGFDAHHVSELLQ